MTTGETLLEGPHLVGAAVAAKASLTRIFIAVDDEQGRTLAAASSAPVTLVDRDVLDHLGSTGTPQSPIAVLSIPGGDLGPGGRVLVPWGVSDPGNCGTLLRSAAAFGYGFGAGPGTADLWAPKVLRAAAGAHFVTRVGRIADMSALRAGGRQVVATLARGGDEPGPLPDAVAILVGSEAHGLPDDLVAASDRRITIATVPGVESLNAAVAGAIVAYLGAPNPATNLPAA